MTTKGGHVLNGNTSGFLWKTSQKKKKWLSEAALRIHPSSVRRTATDIQALSVWLFPSGSLQHARRPGCWFALNDVTYHMVLFPLCLDIPVPWEAPMLLPHSCTLYSLYITERASSPFTCIFCLIILPRHWLSSWWTASGLRSNLRKAN